MFGWESSANSGKQRFQVRPNHFIYLKHYELIKAEIYPNPSKQLEKILILIRSDSSKDPCTFRSILPFRIASQVTLSFALQWSSRVVDYEFELQFLIFTDRNTSFT